MRAFCVVVIAIIIPSVWKGVLLITQTHFYVFLTHWKVEEFTFNTEEKVDAYKGMVLYNYTINILNTTAVIALTW